MDTVTKATSEGIGDELRIHLAEMKARPTVEDTIPIPSTTPNWRVAIASRR